MIFGDDGLSMLQAERLEALTGKRYTSDGRRCRGTTHIRVAAGDHGRSVFANIRKFR